MEENCISKTMMTETVFVAVLVCAVLRLIHRIWWRPRSIEKSLRRQGIRGTSYRFISGDLPEIRRCTREATSKPLSLNHQILPRVIPFYHNMMRQYGKVSLCWYGRRPMLIVGDAELTRFIFTNKNGHFVKPQLNPLMSLLQKGIASLEGEEMATRRRIITPAFQLDKLKAMEQAFLTSCYNLIERWQKQLNPEGSFEVDVALEFQFMAGDVIARTAFGSSYEEGKKIFKLQKEQAILQSEAHGRIYFPGFRFVPTRKNRRRYQIYNEVKAIFEDMIKRRQEAMKKGESGGHDLLSLLIQCKEQNENSLTNDDVIEECKLFYFAGHETTATLLTFTLIILSMNPNWQDKERQEVLEVCGQRAPDFEALNRLKIVSMILYEVLRLYPPVPILSRYTKCETSVGGISVPAGVMLYLPVVLLHYDKSYWGDNVEEFNPERFSEGISKASKDQNAFFAFGWGPRFCLGQNFAFIEAKMALALILQHFSFKLSPSYTHAPCILLTLKSQYGAPLILQSI